MARGARSNGCRRCSQRRRSIGRSVSRRAPSVRWSSSRTGRADNAWSAVTGQRRRRASAACKAPVHRRRPRDAGRHRQLPRLTVTRATADKLNCRGAGERGSYASLPERPASPSKPTTNALPAGDRRGRRDAVRILAASRLRSARAYWRWIEKGGRLHLDHLAMTAGPVTANASGDFTLSPEGLLSGKIILRFTGLEELSQVYRGIFAGFADGGRRLARILMVVTRKVEEGVRRARRRSMSATAFVSSGSCRSTTYRRSASSRGLSPSPFHAGGRNPARRSPARRR